MGDKGITWWNELSNKKNSRCCHTGQKKSLKEVNQLNISRRKRRAPETIESFCCFFCEIVFPSVSALNTHIQTLNSCYISVEAALGDSDKYSKESWNFIPNDLKRQQHKKWFRVKWLTFQRCDWLWSPTLWSTPSSNAALTVLCILASFSLCFNVSHTFQMLLFTWTCCLFSPFLASSNMWCPLVVQQRNWKQEYCLSGSRLCWDLFLHRYYLFLFFMRHIPFCLLIFSHLSSSHYWVETPRILQTNVKSELSHYILKKIFIWPGWVRGWWVCCT